tara:strand:+ start:1057 stop:1599 length:543 start_codon:yes stop_codon:yes gene_type:complete
MIAECLLLLASFQQPIIDTQPTIQEIREVKQCMDSFPKNMADHTQYYIMHFDEENLYTAFRIGWCESRGKSNAFRSEDNDSGVMQFIPNTWKWMVELHGIPEWGEWVITRFGMPWVSNKTAMTNFGFEFQPVQYSAYWNIYAASLLAEDTYSSTRWTDWSSSEWCWGDAEKWELMWRSQE